MVVCLNDLLLSTDTTAIRHAVKDGNVGKHNKDFVPAESQDTCIKRGINSHSMKCTVVWLESLPTALQQSGLDEGTNDQ